MHYTNPPSPFNTHTHTLIPPRLVESATSDIQTINVIVIISHAFLASVISFHNAAPNWICCSDRHQVLCFERWKDIPRMDGCEKAVWLSLLAEMEFARIYQMPAMDHAGCIPTSCPVFPRSTVTLTWIENKFIQNMKEDKGTSPGLVITTVWVHISNLNGCCGYQDWSLMVGLIPSGLNFFIVYCPAHDSLLFHKHTDKQNTPLMYAHARPSWISWFCDCRN